MNFRLALSVVRCRMKSLFTSCNTLVHYSVRLPRSLSPPLSPIYRSCSTMSSSLYAITSPVAVFFVLLLVFSSSSFVVLPFLSIRAHACPSLHKSQSSYSARFELDSSSTLFWQHTPSVLWPRANSARIC